MGTPDGLQALCQGALPAIFAMDFKLMRGRTGAAEFCANRRWLKAEQPRSAIVQSLH
jgi:hypothetical protein